ncbi:MAG: clostripain-related cysteine peptidase [Candidatus Bathyarchaeota archaeon]|nr:clostripain-related cysteine peptidase [Candidatus Bathyarchaeota archaeon]
MAREATDAMSSVVASSQVNLTGTIQTGHEMLQFSSLSDSPSVTRHVMCKDHDLNYDPIDPTTIFRPSDAKAECLTTVSIDDTIEFRWYYRSNSSMTWVSCYNWTTDALFSGEYHYVGYLLIAGYWPAIYYPRAYKVDVYLDGAFSFSEFFEVTNGGLNSPRMCEDVDENGRPINMKSRFTVAEDTRVHHWLRFDRIAYFNEILQSCHNFTAVWIQPNGSTYRTYSGGFADYKDIDVTWNYWEYNYTLSDYIAVDSSTPVGNWKVEVYLDTYYLNNTWMRYGPIATTPFIVGSDAVADWTFMVYLDADSDLELAGIETFLRMASIGSSPQVNIVVQMDRHPDSNTTLGYDDRYGNWMDCKRFYVTEDMIPTPGNATLHLGEVNMGHPDTLKDFVDWTISNYPADYYVLVFYGHGTGCMGVCFDVTDGTDGLFLSELRQGLSGLPAIMDLMLFDACSMGLIEVAYQIKDYANILIGAEGLGFSPAPYEDYLSVLTSMPSMLPNEFAGVVVAAYIAWCKQQPDDPVTGIAHATMSAIDLTRMTSLMAAIDDFALKLKENETFYDYLISSARIDTQGYEGPYADQTGYHIDLYHFAQLTKQYVLDDELRNVADQVMTAVEDLIITEDDKKVPNSHGLAIYFPDEEGKYLYRDFEVLYEATSFALDTSWDEFVRYYLDIQESGNTLTIKTAYPYVSVKIGEGSFVASSTKEVKVFILPGPYAIEVPTVISAETGPDSRVIFDEWVTDGDESNPRTVNIEGEGEDLTLEVQYKKQYRLVVNTSPGGLTPQPNVSPLGLWFDETDTVTCDAQEIGGYVFEYWELDGIRQGLGENPLPVPMEAKTHNVTAYYGLPPPWWETLLRPDIMQVVLGLLGIVLTVAFVVPAWFRSRRKRGVIRTFLSEIDEVYSRFKSDPHKCEQELYRLRNTILEGLTDGKISEESYNILDKRIDKYMEELPRQEKRKRGDE